MTPGGSMPAACWNGKCWSPGFLTDLAGGKMADLG